MKMVMDGKWKGNIGLHNVLYNVFENYFFNIGDT